jgi:hypothetical protein
VKTLRSIREVICLPFVFLFAGAVLTVMHFELQRNARRAMKARNEEPMS